MGCDDYPAYELARVEPEPLVALGPFDRVKADIANAETVTQCKDIRARALAATEYIKAAGLGKPIADQCAEIRLEAEARAGEIIHDDPRIHRGKPNINGQPDRLYLADIDVTDNQSKRWQKIAAVPIAVRHDYYLEAKADAKQDISANGLAIFWGRQRNPEPSDPIPPRDGTYQCIVIDPPWPMHKIERLERPNQGATLDYPILTLQEMADDTIVPVRAHAADNCHIYLWVTHKFLPAGLELLDTWGFRYQCVMTWRKNVGITPYSWMYDTEHVLFGTRGNLPLEQLGLRLSFEAPVQGHSIKPDIFYERVRAASPGPRIDMFARQPREGFDVWGNEVVDAVI